MTDQNFTLDQAMKAQAAMRKVLGLGPETFPAPAFVGMLSDEIEKLRRAGSTDDDIAALIRRETGRELSASDIARFYAPPEKRHPR